jgi:N-acyl-D-amino-acid deacylase
LWQVDFSKTPFSVMAENLQYPFAHHSMVPRVLQKYVREEGVLSLEEAIRKATSLPAQTLHLKGRGTIREGNWADIVIFDAKEIKENANYADPSLPPSGIHYVLVNGTVVVKRGEHTGALPGKVLFHKP